MPHGYRRPAKTRAGEGVTLLPLTDAEAAQFFELQVREFADQKLRAGQWSPEDAMRLSRESISRFLGPGFERRGHRLYRGVDSTRNRVGWIWIGPPPDLLDLGGTATWLYQITVEPSVRGRGFGRGMLQSLETLLRAEGTEAIYLNVFKWNRVAISLYASMGYEVVTESDTDAQMCKRLRP